MCKFCEILFENPNKTADEFNHGKQRRASMEVGLDIARNIIEEVHNLKSEIKHLKIDNHSLSLHLQSYQEQLTQTKKELHKQLSSAIEFANKQMRLRILQQKQLSFLQDAQKSVETRSIDNNNANIPLLKKSQTYQQQNQQLTKTKQELSEQLWRAIELANKQKLLLKDKQESIDTLESENVLLKSHIEKYKLTIKDIREELNQSRIKQLHLELNESLHGSSHNSPRFVQVRQKNKSYDHDFFRDDLVEDKLQRKPTVMMTNRKRNFSSPISSKSKFTGRSRGKGVDRAKSEFIQSALHMLGNAERVKKASTKRKKPWKY